MENKTIFVVVITIYFYYVQSYFLFVLLVHFTQYVIYSRKQLHIFSISLMTFFSHLSLLFYGISLYPGSPAWKCYIITVGPACFMHVKFYFYLREFLLYTQKLTEGCWQTDFGKKHREQSLRCLLFLVQKLPLKTHSSLTLFKGVRKGSRELGPNPEGKQLWICIQLELDIKLFMILYLTILNYLVNKEKW